MILRLIAVACHNFSFRLLRIRFSSEKVPARTYIFTIQFFVYDLWNFQYFFPIQWHLHTFKVGCVDFFAFLRNIFRLPWHFIRKFTYCCCMEYGNAYLWKLWVLRNVYWCLRTLLMVGWTVGWLIGWPPFRALPRHQYSYFQFKVMRGMG